MYLKRSKQETQAHLGDPFIYTSVDVKGQCSDRQGTYHSAMLNLSTTAIIRMHSIPALLPRYHCTCSHSEFLLTVNAQVYCC